MLKNILETRFDPPIRLIKKEQGKICKINGESLVAFLKSGNINNWYVSDIRPLKSHFFLHDN